MPTPANGEGEQRRGGGIWALVGRSAQRAARRQEHRGRAPAHTP